MKYSLKILVAILMFIVVTHASEKAFADSNNTTEKTESEVDNAVLSAAKIASHKHNLSLGVTLPLTGHFSLDLSEEFCGDAMVNCNTGDINHLPGVSLQYDYQLSRYFSFGVSSTYQSMYRREDSHHLAENLYITALGQLMIPIAKQRVGLYFQLGYSLALIWEFKDDSAEFFDFTFRPYDFSTKAGARVWINKRIAIYLDGGFRFGFWYHIVDLRSGVVVRF